MADMLPQYGPKRVSDLDDVPTAYEITKDAKALEVLTVICELGRMIRPFFAPPGVPEERVEALRRAFGEALADPELLGEDKRQTLPISPMRGRGVQDVIQKITNPAPELAALLQDIYKE